MLLRGHRALGHLQCLVCNLNYIFGRYIAGRIGCILEIYKIVAIGRNQIDIGYNLQVFYRS
jgi:hypothetical protein